MSSYYRQQLESWLKTINVKTERVLDLGGAAKPVRDRVGSYEVEETVFFDNGAEEAKTQYMQFDINLPLTQLAGYNVTNYDIEEKEQETEVTIETTILKFDALFCLEVFEYVWNPVQAIENIYNLMNNDSVAYISFPAIYPVHEPWEIDYLRYTKQAIKKYLGMHKGFQEPEITPRVATLGRDFLGAFYSNEKMHPLKRSALPYEIGYLVKVRKLI